MAKHIQTHSTKAVVAKSAKSGRFTAKAVGPKKGRKSAFDRFLDLANSGTEESQRQGFNTMQQATRHR